MKKDLRVGGCDLGKSTAKFVVVRLGEAGPVVESRESRAHDGRPMSFFQEWYRAAGALDALGATGVHAGELVSPILHGLPEEACLARALDNFAPPGAVNLVSVGARGYAVMSRDADGRVQFVENEKCSSGTGETMVKNARRFGLSIDEADRLAQGAREAIPITARCSVFAKSELTHFGNQGKPADALFRGYFESIAHFVGALLARVRVEGPVWFIGGGARLGSLSAAMSRALGVPVDVPAEASYLEALGAALLAADQWSHETPPALPADPGALIVPKERRFRVLEPADRHAHRVRTLPPEPATAGSESAPAILGLDLGSTGAKAVLTSLADGRAVWDLYDTTRGNPVEAAKRLVAAALARGPLDVRAVAVTGSGREAVATVFRAAYPEAGDRIVVANEIIAHATAAIRQDPQRGRSLSVVEIGGQDAKFIQISGGQIVESDMNRACSAGTGSFLEEQAKCYGIDDVREFVRRAREARRPPDLGQMCTVFVAEAAAEALNEGFTLSDVFGGFQYSVVHNYIHRVMSHRVFGETIFFQGKPASGPSLAWTLAAVTGRDVLVPDNPGAMGAWGIGLLAREERRAALDGAVPLDLARFGESRILESKDFQCHEPRCATLCRIEKTTVEGPGGARTVYNGGACPKYEISTAERPKLSLEAPSAFDEREALLAPFAGGAPGENPVGVPWVGALAGLLPWAVTFLKGLGLPVRVLKSDATSLSRGEGRCFSYDSCAPAKLAHGVVNGDVDRVFFPKIIDRPEDRSPGVTCAMEQAMPDILRMSGRSRGENPVWASPALSFSQGWAAAGLRAPLEDAARRLGADPRRVPVALAAAARAQEDYEKALAAIGRRTLDYGRDHGIPIVAVVGSLHVIHDSAINAGVPRLLRTEGVLPLPMDCFPLEENSVPLLERMAWGDAKRALRVGLACRARGDAYPLLLTAFGCSPLSFGEQFNDALLAGHPHTTLESDGHGGTAGYVTRVQAFLHTVRRHDRRPSAPPTEALRWTAPLPEEPLAPGGAPLIVFSVADCLPGILAAAYRAHGVDARPAAPSGASALAAGRGDCTGKECLPYQMLWGTFRKTLDELPEGTPARLLQFSGEGACRNCVFSAKDQMSLARNGFAGRVGIRHFGPEPALGRAFFFRLYAGVVAWESLHQLAAYHGARGAAGARALYDCFGEALEKIMARPGKGGLRGLTAAAGVAVDVYRLLVRASRAFAEMPGAAPLRTALLSGDVYVRLDAGTNDDLVRRLNRLGVAVLVEPLSSLAEYILNEKSAELFRLPTRFPERPLTRAAMVGLRRWFHGAARRFNPWWPTVTPAAMAEGARGKLGRHPRGEAPVTLGSVFSHWNRGLCDGAVVASPWGCGPALVAENLLRHEKEIPLLFLYCDGSPIDDRKLNAFAFRLRRTPARALGGREKKDLVSGKNRTKDPKAVESNDGAAAGCCGKRCGKDIH